MKTFAEIKKEAKQNIKKHYFIYVFCCLLAAYLGTEHGHSFTFLDVFSTGNDNAGILIRGGETNIALTWLSNVLHTDFVSKIGQIPELGTTNGVFAFFYRMISSGTIINYFLNLIDSFTHDPKIGNILLILFALMIHFLFWFFVIRCLLVINRRFFLEGRIYKKIPISRYLFLIQDREWWNTAKVLFLTELRLLLWCLTIVGGVIKYFSYLLVPYLLAENPTLTSKEAISLSQEMMNGHKWEAFKLMFSLIGWYCLDFVTLGISSLVWTNMYRVAIFAEYYTLLRQEELPKHEKELNNPYLFAYAPQSLLDTAYEKEIVALKEKNPLQESYKGWKGFLAKNFGIIFSLNKKELEYEKYNHERWDLEAYKAQIEREEYPEKLSPFKERKINHLVRHLYPARNYTLTAILLLFFFMSFVGWCWEVSLHLIHNGQFVDRGVLHLPWLPIYGFGCIFILLLLKRLRQKPWLEFLSAILLCGFVEYFTSVYLQWAYHTEWWSYKGYFLNLNGRICAEGLLVFGLGGMAFVYFIAPLMDNWFRKIGIQKLNKLAIALSLVFVVDVIYSHFYPNEGQGITTNQVENRHRSKPKRH